MGELLGKEIERERHWTFIMFFYTFVREKKGIVPIMKYNKIN
jgi:hypothetical protein